MRHRKATLIAVNSWNVHKRKGEVDSDLILVYFWLLVTKYLKDISEHRRILGDK